MDTLFPRRHATALVLAGAFAMLTVGSALAQETSPTLYLRPHCEKTKQEDCPLFEASDPSTYATAALAAGEPLDVDVVLANPTGESISKVKVWLSYDADVLEGKTVTVSTLFPVVVPGESDFSPVSGYAKVGASAAAGKEPKDAILPIAHLIFTVKQVTSASTPLSFYDQRSGKEGHTAIITTASPNQNLLAEPLGTLLVQLDTPSGPDVTGTASSASSVAPVPSAPSSPDVGSFGLIQVQNVRVGTKDSFLYVTWDLLSYPKLQGYNVYYGTMKGRYLQKRSVSLASRGAVIRDLPKGKTYYVAVRGVDDQNRETSFSTEASIEIGNAATASSQIIGSLDAISESSPTNKIAPKNPVENVDQPLGSGVPGKSGAPSALLLLLLGSAVIGTLLAFRRQMIAKHSL